MDALRSALQPITHHLPAPVAEAARSLLGPSCYQTLLLDIDPLGSPSCVKLAISKGLGIGIIGASAVVKVPQLLKLLRARSAAGVSFLAYLLETAAYLISLAYNVRHAFPVSTYGETALIAVQNVAIAACVLHYQGRPAAAGVFVAGLAAAGYALFRPDIVDVRTLALLQAGAGVLGVASKAPQIWTVWRQGGTGQLSAFAVFNYLLGSLSRIFTTLQEVPDPLILYGFVAGFALNAVLACQMLYYWNAPAPSKEGSAKRGKKVPVPAAAAGQPTTATTATGAAPKRSAKSPSTRRRG